jgi:cathepsin A (carboxypeptidase C)
MLILTLANVCVGYYTVEEKLNKNYFYWLFESRSNPSTDPLIMWLTGGPGCSSQLALLSENGPCSVTADGMSTVNNPFSWNTNANIMWVDQPAGVGYSYGVKNDKNETMVK